MRKLIFKETKYPFYKICDVTPSFTGFEIPADKVKWIKDSFDTFDSVQNYLQGLWHNK